MRRSAFQEAAQHFHREVMPELLSSIDTDLYEAQHLVAATLTLPVAALSEVKARLQAMVEHVATVADDPVADGDARRVYQLAVQLVRVSEEMG